MAAIPEPNRDGPLRDGCDSCNHPVPSKAGDRSGLMSRVLLVVAVIVGVLGTSSAQDALRPSPSNPAADQGPLIIQAQVVDPAGKPLPGVDVLVAVWYTLSSETTRQVFEPTVTDRDGRIRVEIVRERPGERASSAMVWAYQPGHAIAASPTFSANAKAPPPALRLVLDESGKRTITVIGPDDQPIPGLRLVPVAIHRANRARPDPTARTLVRPLHRDHRRPRRGDDPRSLRRPATVDRPDLRTWDRAPCPPALGCAAQRDSEAGSAGATGRHRPRRIGAADRGGPAGNPGPGGRQLAARGRLPAAPAAARQPQRSRSIRPCNPVPRAPSRLRPRC